MSRPYPRVLAPALALAISAALPASALALTENLFVSNTDDSGDGSLRQALLDANAASPNLNVNIVIQTAGTLTLKNPLPAITNTHTLGISGQTSANGAPTFTVDGNNAYRGFFIYATDTATQSTRGTVAISNLTIQNTLATGGAGGIGTQAGGGGAGLGGAVFVGMGNVSLTNVALNHNSAVGGNGGAAVTSFVSDGNTFHTGNGAGGGLGGVGGSGATVANGLPGGGGGGGVRGSFPDQTAAGGSFGGSGTAGALTGFPSAGSTEIDSSTPGAAGGGGAASASYAGGGGGVSNSNSNGGSLTVGGNGGFGGGGGGALGNGGDGGYGGGSGGGQDFSGTAGFGGGSGGGQKAGSANGYAGFGGGAGGDNALPSIPAAGGGGLGAGGALFVRAGNSLSLTDVTFSSNAVTGGTGGSTPANTPTTNGNAGAAIGSALFLGNTTTLSVSAGKTISIADSLGGGNDPQASGALIKTGPGSLLLSSTNNSYTGGTTVTAGTLRANNYSPTLGPSGSATGTGEVLVNSSATLGGNGQFTSHVSLAGNGSKLDPGPDANTRDLLYFNAGLSVAPASVLHYDIAPTSYDGDQLLVVGGTLSLTGPITLDITGPAQSAIVGNTYNLIDYQLADTSNLDPSQFTFAPGSVTGTLSVQYDILTLTVSPVPEPATTLLLTLLTPTLLARRRRNPN